MNPVRPLLAALVAAFLVLVGVQASAEPPPAAVSAAGATSHASDAACGHCHEDVHQGTVGEACERCHTTESWVPSLFSVKDHASTRFPLEGRHTEASCSLCHPNGKLVGQPTTCAGCHLDRHRGKLGEDCAECHSNQAFRPVEGFDHAARTGFALTGPHAAPTCADCHSGANGRALLVSLEPTCATCHPSSHGDFGACEDCHRGDQAFAAASKSYDHRVTAFPLERRHSALPCSSCHPAGQVAASTSDECGSCHVDPHAGQLSMVCGDCHKPDRWRLVRFDHDSTMVPLRGRHFVAPCASCHTDQRWIGLTTECWGCHALDAARAPASIPAHRQPGAECGDCHGSWTW